METNNGDPYTTTDMYFAAYLKVAAVPFIDTEKKDKQVVFLFENQGGTIMRDLKRQYFSGKSKVSALDLVQSIKWAKQLTHL